jgi:phosphoserine phosphatase
MSGTAITLICNPAEQALDEALVDEVAFALLEAFGDVARRTLSDGVAEDFLIDAIADRAAVEATLDGVLAGAPVDIVAQPAEGRRKLLLIADMDSTIIGQECIDELADYAGLKAEIAAITERAMRGELDFEAALSTRVGMLKGLEERVLEACFRERIRLNPGAETLIATMRGQGATCILVSGGFTFFVERVARLAGFNDYRANDLIFENGALTGAVAQPILGREAKAESLRLYKERLGLPREATLAVGDGANDLDMIAEAGLGVAFHAKPKVAAAAGASLSHADLTGLLYAQGYAEDEFCAG